MKTLGIIAGGGSLPAQIIEYCRNNKRSFFVLVFENSFDQEIIKNVPHAIVRIGAVGEALQHLRNAGVEEIVMAGGIKRPSLTSLRPDAAGATLLKKLGKAFFMGDDALLKTITEFFEEEDFKVVGAHSILNNILAGEGVLGKIVPDNQANADIMIGMAAAKNLGAMDIGQAVIVKNSKVVGTEDSAGTDAMLSRYANIENKEQKTGILVKAKKPNQEEKVDLPSIGVQTIENLHAAGLAGVAIEAYGSLLIDKNELIKKADEYGLFVVGVKYE